MAGKTVTRYVVQSKSWIYNDEFYELDNSRYEEDSDLLETASRPRPPLERPGSGAEAC